MNHRNYAWGQFSSKIVNMKHKNMKNVIPRGFPNGPILPVWAERKILSACVKSSATAKNASEALDSALSARLLKWPQKGLNNDLGLQRGLYQESVNEAGWYICCVAIVLRPSGRGIKCALRNDMVPARQSGANL